MHGGDIYRNKVELDFSVNINPLGIPKSVRDALIHAMEKCSCYPDINYKELKKAIHSMTGAEEDNILCGNGASELFPAIVRAIRYAGGSREMWAPGRVIIPVPAFSGYERAARSCHMEIDYYEMKREDGFCLKPDIIETLSEDTKLLFLSNPNNPTGNLLEENLLEEILQACLTMKIIVLLDESFLIFTNGWMRKSYVKRTEVFPNLIVVSSLTKAFAIPGVRLGYLVCRDPFLLREIEEQLPEWNLSVFAQSAGIAASGETEYLLKSRNMVKTERDYLMGGLQKLGLTVFPGEADYLLFYTEYPLWKELLQRGTLIRDCSDFKGLSQGYYRIAVRPREENARLLAQLKEILCR